MEATENAYCAYSVHCHLYHDYWKLSIKCNRLVNEALYNYALLIMYTVTLSSSADSLCPGDGVVFTCVTDTGRLIWDISDITNTLQQTFHSPAQLNKNIAQDIFIITLLNITGESDNIYHSTVTAVHVPITYNGTTVACSGQVNALGINNPERTIVIG